MFDSKELKFQIEKAERSLQFYIRYEEELLKGYSAKQLEVLINEQLDILSKLYKLKESRSL